MSAYKSAANKPKEAHICKETRFATKERILNKTLFVTKARISQLQLGHVIIGMIPAIPSMHENHALDHKKIVNIV